MLGLSNREIAILMWSVFGFLFVVRNESVRDALSACCSAFRNAKVWGIIVLFVAYLSACTLAALDIGVWSAALLKDSILWFVFSGFVLLLNALDAAKTPQFFRRTLRSLVSMSAVFTFVMNLESFTLLAELVLQPVSFAIVMCIFISQTEEKYRDVRKFFVAIITLIICGTMFNTIRILVEEPTRIDFGSVAKLFALPVWLTLVSIPFIFLFALVATYEDIIVRMSFRTEDRSVPLHSKLALIRTLKWRLYELRALDAKAMAGMARSSTYREARCSAEDFLERRLSLLDQAKRDVEVAPSKH